MKLWQLKQLNHLTQRRFHSELKKQVNQQKNLPQIKEVRTTKNLIKVKGGKHERIH